MLVTQVINTSKIWVQATCSILLSLQVYYLHGNFPSVYVPVDILTSQLQAANTLEDQLTVNNNNKQQQ